MDKIVSLISTVRSITSDWLFDIFVKYRENRIAIANKEEQNLLLEKIVVQLSALLSVCFVSQHSIEDELVDIATDFVRDQNINNSYVERLCKLIQNYRAWIRGDLSTDAFGELSKHHAFSLLWLVLYYSDYMENNFIFKCIQSSRNYFELDKENPISKWGLGLLCYHQACVIKNVTHDGTLQLVTQIQDKGLRYVLSYIESQSTEIEDFRNLYVQHKCYYLASVYGQKGNNHLTLTWFIKAKIEYDLPTFERIVSNKCLQYVTQLFDFQTIYQESNQHSKERLEFLNDTFERENSKFSIPIAEIPLEKSLSESMLMKDLISRSTMDLLGSSALFDYKAFFKPVVPIETSEAQKRLKERMDFYELESRREIPGDGNCQFYSLSDQLTWKLKHSSFIRRCIVDWLKMNEHTILENGAKVSDFSYDKEWKDYVDSMSMDKTWGDHLTLIAASEIFHKTIVIVSSIPNDNFVLEIQPNINKRGNTEPEGKLILSHLTEFHYGSVQEKNVMDNSVLYDVYDL